MTSGSGSGQVSGGTVLPPNIGVTVGTVKSSGRGCKVVKDLPWVCLSHAHCRRMRGSCFLSPYCEITRGTTLLGLERKKEKTEELEAEG